MRVRINTPGRSVVSSLAEYHNGTYTQNIGPWSHGYTPYYEYIEDHAGSKEYLSRGTDGGRVMKMQPCYHIKWAYEPNLANAYAKISTPEYVMACPNSQMVGWGLRSASNYDAGSELASSVMDLPGPVTSKFEEHWLGNKPSMVSRANLSVFTYELEETKRMFDVLPLKHIKKCKNWTDVLYHLGKYGNGLHLGYNFGWKPFINDCKKVGSSLASFNERLEKFCRNAGKDLLRHGRTPDVTLEGEIADPSPPDGWFFITTYKGSAEWCSTFDLSYEIPKYSESELRMRAVADSLALTPSLETVWTVIPWSFVVDWFVDVGAYLHQYSRDWIQPWVQFAQSCCSLKWEVEAVRSRYSPYTPARTVSVAGRVKLTRYQRHVGMPKAGLAALGTDDLNADKIRLLASLIGSVL